MKNKKCSIPGCDRNYEAKGYCHTHYERNRRTGSPLGSIPRGHGLTNHEIYPIWSGIKSRCHNKNDTTYRRYGGRGIAVCGRWLHSFPNFLEDMGCKPFPEAQIDRIDNDGDYSPDNCHWVTSAENNRNTSITKLSVKKVRDMRFDFNKGKSRKNLAKKYKCSYSLVVKVIRNEAWKGI